jgi:predicted transcriptional regulator
MVFNGLSKSDLIVYNALLQSPSRVSISQLASLCNCHPITVWRSLRRLEDDGMVSISRERRGIPNSYQVVKD